MSDKLTVIATYWNEIEWVEYSLRQIEMLDPDFVVLMDGNFDPSFPISSSDGTRDKLLEFVANHENSIFWSVERLDYPRASVDYLFNLFNRPIAWLYPWRFCSSFSWMWRLNIYRLNQCINFSKALLASPFSEPGNWLMTVDADQYYSDDFYNIFSNCRDDRSIWLVSGNELTFLNDHKYFTRQHESRIYNNMPHRIFADTEFYPTRHLIRSSFFKYKLYNEFPDNILDGGNYFHYKFREDAERLALGYRLGDRKPLDPRRFVDIREYLGPHPLVVREKFRE